MTNYKDSLIPAKPIEAGCKVMILPLPDVQKKHHYIIATAMKVITSLDCCFLKDYLAIGMWELDARDPGNPELIIATPAQCLLRIDDPEEETIQATLDNEAEFYRHIYSEWETTNG